METVESLQSIDSRIEHHHRVLQDLRGRRNLLVPISCLIPDILCLIFRFSVAEAGREDLVSWDNIANQRLWFGDMRTRYNAARRGVELSHVCRHWRAVARADALLWTQVLMTSEKWCWRMLERSKQAPLSVRVYLPSVIKPSNPLFRSTYHTLAHLPRVQHLLLSNGMSGSSSDVVMDQLLKPAPLVESVCLVNSGVTTWTKRETISEDIFDGCTPRLRHLGVSGYDIPWTSHLLTMRSVTHLELSTIINWKHAQLGNLLKVLGNMRDLHTLTLRDAIPSGTADSDLRIELPKLMRLTLFDEFTECVGILQHIDRIPPAAVVRVWPNNIVDTGDVLVKVRSLFNLIAPFCKGTRTVHFTGRRRNPSVFVRLECWPKELKERGEVQTTQPPTSKVSLAVRCVSFPGPLPEVVREMASIFTLSDVRTFSYEGVDREDYFLDAWAEALAVLHSIETFRGTAQTFAILMNVANRDPEPASVLPHLHTLILDAVSVTTVLFGKLRRFIALRKGVFKTIKIYESSIRRLYVTELESLIEVVWDKKDPGMILADVLLGEDSVDEGLSEAAPLPAALGLDIPNMESPFKPADEADEI